MVSFYLVGFFFAIIVIVYWTRQNDTVPPGGRTKGLLRMTSTENGTGNLPDQSGERAASSQDGPRRTEPLPGLRRHL